MFVNAIVKGLGEVDGLSFRRKHNIDSILNVVRQGLTKMFQMFFFLLSFALLCRTRNWGRYSNTTGSVCKHGASPHNKDGEKKECQENCRICPYQ